MVTARLRQAATQVRTSRFGQEVLGPKVAEPLGNWLQDAFAPPVSSAPDDTPEPEVVQPVAVVEATPVPEQGRMGRARDIAMAVKDRIKEHNLIVVAAGIAFWGLLAIPALLVSVISIGGLVFDAETIKQQVKDRMSRAPDEVTEIIGEQLEGVAGGSTGGLITGVVVGIALALWTTSGAMAKMMGTLNTIYGVRETRKFVALRGTAVLMTFGGVVFVLAAMFLVAALPAILRRIDGVGGTAAALFSLATYPILGLVMVLCLGVLYRWGPNRSDRYQMVTAGAVVATVLWVLAMVGFSVYTNTVASYNETYGSLGGLVMLLLFLLITALMVLLGAEVHAVTRERSEAKPALSDHR